MRAGILRDVRPLEFEHALVRDAVVSGLTAGARAELHAHAARILGEAGAAPETVAVHLLHADPRGDEAVAMTLAAAGRRALASGALDEADACLDTRARRASCACHALGAAGGPRTRPERARAPRGARSCARGVRRRPRSGRPGPGGARRWCGPPVPGARSHTSWSGSSSGRSRASRAATASSSSSWKRRA